MSRNKGGRGEREAIALLQPVIDRVCEVLGTVRFELRRDYRQRFEAKRYDIVGLPWFAFEIKRHENHSGREGWWRQVMASAREGQVPVLMYRKNHGPWIVRTRVPIRVVKGGVAVRCTVEMCLEDFLVYLEQFLLDRLKITSENH
jgi:hypothetical protein